MKHEYMIMVSKNFFTVYVESPSAKRLLRDFISKKFHTFRLIYDPKKRRKVRELDKVFVGGNHNFNEYRFNINFVKDFMWMLKIYSVNRDNINIVREEIFKTNRLDINLRSEYILRDYQEKAFTRIVKDDSTPTKLIDHQTGKGKGMISISSMCAINKATAILILPKYIDKWIEELKEKTDIKDDDILVIRGSKDLILATEMAISGEYVPKVIIFSNRTIYLYIKAYESLKDMDDFIYPVVPSLLMETFGIGTLLIDEVHQEFFSVYKASLYFNVEHFIGMSATLETDNESVGKFYRALFPVKSKLANIEYDKYIDIHAVQYTIENAKRIRAVGSMGYTHIGFEQSIMRHSIQLRNYVDMICNYIKVGYLDRRKDGDKIIIFASSIEFCTMLTEYFKTKYDYLSINRYVEDDPYENLQTADMVVTTVLSAGTAVDIKGLITVIQTISMKSKQANLQALGRLRKKEGRDMRFYYFYTKDIEKQYEYHKSRIELFKSKSKNIFIEEYNKKI